MNYIDFISLLTYIFAFIIAITFHEAAHAATAYIFKDDTAKRLGRLTFNPLAHIDPMGTIILPGFLTLTQSPILFGWAKPVPVQFENLVPKRLGMFCVAFAGPFMNLFLAWFSALLLHINIGQETLGNDLLILMVRINSSLAIFNLIPISPLDGGRIVESIIPNRYRVFKEKFQSYGMLILIILIFFPVILNMIGISFDPLRWVLYPAISYTIKAILFLSFHF